MRDLKRKSAGLAAVLGLVAAFALLSIGSASAVHDANIIELDGNIVDGAVGNDPSDWASIFAADGSTIPANLPTGVGDTTDVIRDFAPGANGPDPSYHEPSNKDDQPINPAGGSGVWGCVSVPNPTDKVDIVNAYALAAQKGGDQYIYFGVERYDNSGDAFIGLWFFQDEVGCNTATNKFTGSKQTGDILLLINFTGGGGTVSVQALTYTQHPTNPNNLPGTLTLNGSTNVRCTSIATPPSDNFCAETNSANTFVTPWPMEDKEKPGPPKPDPVRTVDEFQFFEGGINLTDTFNLTSPICISSFMAETRSSSSVDATLKDYALGDLNTCGTVNVLKYHDKNADGVHDLDGADDTTPSADDEGPLQGWTIFIDEDDDGVKDAGEISGVTGSNGLVTFSNLQAGTYKICEVLQTNWTNSDPGAASVTPGVCKSATIASEDTVTIKFGNFQKATKSGVKFNDLNGNGAKDSGEPGLNGWTIRVYKDADGDGILEDGDDGTVDTIFTVHASQVTATVSSVVGVYSFQLDPGSYIVCEVLQTSWEQKFPHSATTGKADCSAVSGLGAVGWAISLLSQQQDTDNHFGNAQLHRIIVLVCHETDNTLVGAGVTIDSTTKTSITTPPSGITQAQLCGLGGATFGGLPHGSKSATVNIPSSGTGSGH